MENTPVADPDSAVKPECSNDSRAHCISARLRRENTDLRKRVGRLRSLQHDVSEFKTQKREMLDDLYRSCARERKLKERVHEAEMKNASILDTLADLKYLKRARNARRLRLNNLKRSEFIAKCSLEDVQYALVERDEIIRKRDAEINELSDLDKNCYLHVRETRARLQDAETALRQWQQVRARVKKINWAKTPKVRRSRWNDMLVTACSFALTMLFLLVVFSLVIPLFSREEHMSSTCHGWTLSRNFYCLQC